MTYNAFLFPEAILDTPRLFTAIAEWLAILVYFNICRRRVEKKAYVVYCVLSAGALILFQFIAGLLSIAFWVPMMIGAVGLMYLFLYMVLEVTPMDCGVITVHAFVLAEFAASVYRQDVYKRQILQVLLTENRPVLNTALRDRKRNNSKKVS